MPPQKVPPVVCPGPLPVMIEFSMSKAAPLRKTPPPGLFVTLQSLMWRVTAFPLVGAALIPMPVELPP